MTISGLLVPSWHTVVPKSPIEMRWIYYLLSQLRLPKLATTTGVPGLNRNDLYDIEVAVPSIIEQRRIVEILDQVERLRRRRAEADGKTDRILRALFINMFGKPSTTWNVARLVDLLRPKKGALQSGPFGTHLHNHDFVSSGTVLAVGIDNVLDGEFVPGRNRRITRQKYQELKKYTLEQGDVLITIMGTVGRTCVFPGSHQPAICTKHVYRIQLDRSIDPEYLSATLRFSERVRAQLGASVTGQIVSALTSKVLKRLVVVVPPMALQHEFATRKRAIDAIRHRARHAQKRGDALSSVLVQRAFSGQLTASWRERNMKGLIGQMELQTEATT